MIIKAAPILRWPGGKTRILHEILDRMPGKFGCLHEPFIGGGALSFALQSPGQFISDLNSELISFYNEVKHRPDLVAGYLRNFMTGAEFFYQLRSADRNNAFNRKNASWRAARYLFINRSCFNGIMRVNFAGQLNCAYGFPKNSTYLYDEDSIYDASRALRAARICHAGFEGVENRAKSGDFIYLDPPYLAEKQGYEIRYTNAGFSLKEQEGLAQLCDRLTRRNIYWMVSNSNADFIKKLYSHYKIEEIEVRRSISCDPFTRGKVCELIITNY